MKNVSSPVHVKVVADSHSPAGARLTTMLCTYPTSLHELVLSHRMLSRNWKHSISKKSFFNYSGPVAYTTTALITATTFNGIVSHRLLDKINPGAEALAIEIQKALISSRPKKLIGQEWHLPFIDSKEEQQASMETLRLVSVARCARLGEINSIDNDVAYTYSLLAEGPFECGPFEHQGMGEAQPTAPRGNFTGFRSFRWELNYFYQGNGLAYWEAFKNRGMVNKEMH